MLIRNSPFQSLGSTVCRWEALKGYRREGQRGRTRSPASASASIAPVESAPTINDVMHGRNQMTVGAGIRVMLQWTR